MKILISEYQLRKILISEQEDYPGAHSSDNPGYDDYQSTGNEPVVDTHTALGFLSIGSLFIPVIGPLLSATISGYDMKLYFDEAKTSEEKAMVALGCVLMLMPGLKSSLNLAAPTIKQVGSKVLFNTGKKLITNKSNELSIIEKQVIKEVGVNQKEISMALQQKVKPFAKSIKKVEPKGKPPRERSWMDFDKRPTEVKVFENQKYEYIQKYGQDRFNKLESSFKSGKITEERFKGWLNVRTKTIPLKQLPRKFYHGTQNKITFEELDPFYRKETYKEFDPMRSRTGSSNPENVGIYFTDNINGDYGYNNYERNITFGKYKNTKGFESASKWAKHGNENGYIYEITLKPTATIVENGTLNSNVVNVTTNMYDKLKSFNVDAIWSGNELNVLNKDAIQTFKPIFKFDYKTSKWIKL